ncbi:MAG: hypothetical protein HC886_23875 [Leptolyngbyaceae cyanobacterium SM1_1_3]|nr:hypothetical protein [Leptolyngbyaceae cyanobacterium SM1_1_3]
MSEQLFNPASELLMMRNQASVAQTLKHLWLWGSAATAIAALTLAVSHPKHWLPISYAGGAIAISLTLGASTSGNREQILTDAADSMNAARPLRAIANDYCGHTKRQLRSFDNRVADLLADEWRKQNLTMALQPASEPLPSPAHDLGTNPQSALIGGVPGAGKAVFYLTALAKLRDHNPAIKVFILDPKNSPLETGVNRFDGVTVWRRTLAQMSPDDGSQWILDCIDEFKQHQGPKLLILDEAASVMATLKLASRTMQAIATVRAFLAHITSMGDGERHYLWLVTQDASTEGLGISSALRATLRAIAIIAPHNRQALSAFLAGNWLPIPDDGREGLDALMDRSPVDRAIFDGKQGRWMPMERLENLTGFDRDSRTQLQPAHDAQEAPATQCQCKQSQH